MEELQKIIEEANEKLVIAKMNGQFEIANSLQILIGEAEVALRGLQDAD